MTDLKDFSGVKITRVDTLDEAEACLHWLGERREILAADTETGGLNGEALKWWKPGFQVRLVQFGDTRRAFVLRPDRHGAVIEKILKEYKGDIVGHNFLGFDQHALLASGFSLPSKTQLHDTLLQSKILDSRGKHGLKFLAEREFGTIAALGERALNAAFELHGFGKDKGRGFSEIPYGVPAYDAYSALDVILTARLYSIQAPKIAAEFKEAYERELGAWHVTFEHEHKGLPVDLEFAKHVESEYEMKLEMLRDELKASGITKPGSKTQRLEVLYAEGFEATEFTETGEVKLDKKLLEAFASPTAQLLIEYGRIEHWLTAYIRKTIDEAYCGHVFPSIQPVGAKTGRQSASNPPVQQLPSHHEDAWKMRAMYLPRAGDTLWSIDMDAEENRLLAHFSGDTALTQIITDKLDIHTYTAAQIYDVLYEIVTKEQRGIAKTYRYASTYGAGIAKLAKGLNLGEQEVRKIRKITDDAFAGVTAWKKEVENLGKQRFYAGEGAWVLSSGGRKIFAEEYPGYDPKFYTLSNYVLQASGADILKEQLNRVAAGGLSEYVYLGVHDEILYSLPEGQEGADIAHELAGIMAFDNGEFNVPMTCSEDGPFDRWQGH